MLNVILQVTHKHEIASLIPAAVQSVVIDVAENSTCADTVSAVLSVDELAQAVHDDGAVLSFTLFLVLLRLREGGGEGGSVATTQIPKIFLCTMSSFTLLSPCRPRLRRWAL